MAKYLITGGAGFIGSNIVEELLKRGEDVAVFDNFSTGRRENLDSFQTSIEIIEGDLRDADAVRRAVAGRTYVIHQAALPSVPRSVQDPMSSNDVNVIGTLNVLLAALDTGVKRVVAASSSSVYGDTPKLPKVETMNVAPMSPYAVSKLAAEKYCAAFYHVYGLETVALRYFNIFGPRQDPTSQYSAVIPKFITAFMRGESPVVHGDGTQSRDFTYISNAVEANLLACTAPEAAGEYFNIACGERYTLLDVLKIIGTLMEVDISPKFTERRAGDVMHSLADISKAQGKLGYRVIADLNEGLANTVDYFVKVPA